MRLLIVLAGAVSLAAACDYGPRSAAGFRLPQGEIARGQAAFVELRCTACHTVSGLDLPSPVAEPAVPVVLGGAILNQKTDGELVTSIINPSHKLASGYRKVSVQSGGLSRMGDFSEALTVRQLVDIVAFLHGRYRVVQPGR